MMVDIDGHAILAAAYICGSKENAKCVCRTGDPRAIELKKKILYLPSAAGRTAGSIERQQAKGGRRAQKKERWRRKMPSATRPMFQSKNIPASGLQNFIVWLRKWRWATNWTSTAQIYTYILCILALYYQYNSIEMSTESILKCVINLPIQMTTICTNGKHIKFVLILNTCSPRCGAAHLKCFCLSASE